MQNEVTVAVITLTGVVIVAIVGWLNNRHIKRTMKAAEEVSDAVNHTHKNGGKRIYDVVLELSQEVRELTAWREKWRDLDPDIRDGHSLSDKIDGLERNVHSLRTELRDHVEWEMRHPATDRK